MKLIVYTETAEQEVYVQVNWIENNFAYFAGTGFYYEIGNTIFRP